MFPLLIEAIDYDTATPRRAFNCQDTVSIRLRESNHLLIGQPCFPPGRVYEYASVGKHTKAWTWCSSCTIGDAAKRRMST